MDRYTDYFNEHAENLRLMHEAADHDDYNHAVSGANVGRQRKHLPNDVTDPITGKKKRGIVEEILHRTLQDWLRDEQYRIRHQNLMFSLHDAAEFTQTTLEHVKSELFYARANMEELLSKAAKLDDGTIVFKDKDDNVRNEDGETILPELATQVQWRGDESSYEGFLLLQNHIRELENAERELRGIETEIGGIRNKATDNDNPYLPDELEPATNTVDDLLKRVKKIEVDIGLQAPDNASSTSVETKYTDDIDADSLSQKPLIDLGGKP